MVSFSYIFQAALLLSSASAVAVPKNGTNHNIESIIHKIESIIKPYHIKGYYAHNGVYPIPGSGNMTVTIKHAPISVDYTTYATSYTTITSTSTSANAQSTPTMASKQGHH